MNLWKPSVLKELRKRAEAASQMAKIKNEALIKALEYCVPFIDRYKNARRRYEELLSKFGEKKYGAIVDGKLQPAGGDVARFQEIIRAGDEVELAGDKFVPAESTITRARRELDEALKAEKAAYEAISKYLQDKSTQQGLGAEKYKKWKVAVRAELFK